MECHKGFEGSFELEMIQSIPNLAMWEVFGWQGG